MKKYIVAAMLCTLALFSCKKEEIVSNGELSIVLDARVGNHDFTLNKDLSVGDQTYQFSGFRYWVSNLVLIKTDGSEVKVPNAYYLMEETGEVEVQDGDFIYPSKKRETITLSGLPDGNYKSIRFSVGVDSRYNDNLSLQAGELSQLSGMTNISWMWHTSYIFSALAGVIKEGTETTPIKIETGMNANYKSVALNLPTTISLAPEKTTTVEIAVAVDKIFDGIDLNVKPIIGGSQSAEMEKVAANYESKVFSVKTVR